MFDNHIHSHFSGDSDLIAEDAITRAIELGLAGITFSDHLDIDYPNYKEIFMIDFDLYNKFMDSLKIKYDKKIKVLKGIEIGFQPHVEKEMLETVNKYHFDSVIASVHIVDKTDLHNGDFCRGKAQKEAYLRYFEEVLTMVKTIKNYDILGHIDMIIRYGDYENKSYLYSDYSEILDEILLTLIENNKSLELNVSGFRYGLQSTMPGFDVIKRYKELGGANISLGSDAHSCEYIGYRFKELSKRLQGLGFQYIVYYENRNICYCKID